MFVSKFTAADTDKNLLLNSDELLKSLADIPVLNKTLSDAPTLA
jgi:hypothetical protein